jgi:hypothetical protein
MPESLADGIWRRQGEIEALAVEMWGEDWNRTVPGVTLTPGEAVPDA